MNLFSSKMRGFKQFKKIIENNSISRNFDNVSEKLIKNKIKI